MNGVVAREALRPLLRDRPVTGDGARGASLADHARQLWAGVFSCPPSRRTGPQHSIPASWR